MNKTSARLLLWGPRILGLALCAFLALFALDAFNEQGPLSSVVGAFLIHLVPAAVLLVVVALSWRWEWVGGISFVTLAAAYAASVWRGHPDWVLVISGPLLIVGALFLWSWSRHAQLRDLA